MPLWQFARTQCVSTASMQRQEGAHLHQATERNSWSESTTSAWTDAHSFATAMVAPQESFLPWSQFLHSLLPSLTLIRQLLLLSTSVKACPWPSRFFAPQWCVDAMEVTGDWGPCHFVQHVRRTGQFCRCLRTLGVPLVSTLDLAPMMLASSILARTVGQKLLVQPLHAWLAEVEAVNSIHAERRLHGMLLLTPGQLTAVVRQPNKGCLPLF